jgi:hypothetical protein
MVSVIDVDASSRAPSLVFGGSVVEVTEGECLSKSLLLI